MTFVVLSLSRNVRRCTVAGRPLQPSTATTTATTTVVVAVDSCTRARRYQCPEGHVVRENSPSPSSSLCQKYHAHAHTLTRAHNSITRVCVCKHLPHGSPTRPSHHTASRRSPLPALPSNVRFFLNFNYCNIACIGIMLECAVVFFLATVLAILVVAHGRPRGVCTCLAVSVIGNTIIMVFFFFLLAAASSCPSSPLLHSVPDGRVCIHAVP